MLPLRGISSVRQTHTTEPLVPQPRPDGAEIAIETMEMHKSSGRPCYQITAGLIQEGSRTRRNDMAEY